MGAYLTILKAMAYAFHGHHENIQYLQVWLQGWKCREKITKKQMIVTIIRIDKKTILK